MRKVLKIFAICFLCSLIVNFAFTHTNITNYNYAMFSFGVAISFLAMLILDLVVFRG